MRSKDLLFISFSQMFLLILYDIMTVNKNLERLFFKQRRYYGKRVLYYWGSFKTM